jgi:hypothetical protein
MIADIIHAAQVLSRDVQRFGTGIKQMQVLDPRCD